MEMSYSVALEILSKKLPDEIINNIRKYMVNEIAYEALQQYFNYLYKKKKNMKSLFGTIMYIQNVHVIIVQIMVSIKYIKKEIVMNALNLNQHLCTLLMILLNVLVIILNFKKFITEKKEIMKDIIVNIIIVTKINSN